MSGTQLAIRASGALLFQSCRSTRTLATRIEEFDDILREGTKRLGLPLLDVVAAIRSTRECSAIRVIAARPAGQLPAGTFRSHPSGATVECHCGLRIRSSGAWFRSPRAATSIAESLIYQGLQGDRRSSRGLASRKSIAFGRLAVAMTGSLGFHRYVPYARRNNGRRSMNRLISAQATFTHRAL
jgi:hypothetical protein